MRTTLQEQLQTVAEKLKEPLLPTHIVNWLFTVILLGCISHSKVDINSDKAVCQFARDEQTCSSTKTFAAVAFVVASTFVVVELAWEKVANYHRYIYFAELVVSAVFALVFFGFFIKLAHEWTNTDSDLKAAGQANPGASIAVSLLSIFSWSALAYFSYKGYKEDDLGGIERLGTYGQYVDPVTSAYHAGYEETDPPVP